MSYLGLHYQNHSISYCVMEDTDHHLEIIAISHIPIPRSLPLADQLSIIRTHIHSMIHEYNNHSGYLKLNEYPKEIDTFSLYVEGVILEALSTSQLSVYDSGNQNDLGKQIEQSDLYVQQFIGNTHPEYRDLFTSLTEAQRVTILAAEAAYYLLEEST